MARAARCRSPRSCHGARRSDRQRGIHHSLGQEDELPRPHPPRATTPISVHLAKPAMGSVMVHCEAALASTWSPHCDLVPSVTKIFSQTQLCLPRVRVARGRSCFVFSVRWPVLYNTSTPEIAAYEDIRERTRNSRKTAPLRQRTQRSIEKGEAAFQAGLPP